MPIKDKKKYNAYMQNYMPDYRKQERELLREIKKLKGIPDRRKRKR